MPIHYLKNIVMQKDLYTDVESYTTKSLDSSFTKYVEGYYLFEGIESDINHWMELNSLQEAQKYLFSLAG